MRICTGFLILLWTASASVVADSDGTASLTLRQSIALVLEHNPQLQAADFDARAAAARVRQQSQAAPWTAGMEVENFAGTGQRQGFDAAETTLSLGRVLELGDKPHLRGEVARLDAGLLRHDQDALRLDLLAEAARRFLAIARVQEQRALARDRLELMQRTLDAVNRRIRVGKAPAAERSRVEIDFGRAQLALEETDHLLRTSRRQLAVLWGDFEPDFTGVHADLLTLEPDPDFETLAQRLEGNPALARLATMERLAQARVRLAQAGRRADLDMRAGLKHFSDTDDVGLAVSLRVPLGSAQRAAPYEAEAAALAAREPLLAQNQNLALRATLFSLHQELLHSRDRLEALQQRIVPAAQRTLDDYTKGFAIGRYSLLELTEAQKSLLQARLEVIDAAAEHHAFFIEIHRLIGTAARTGDAQ